MKTYAIGATSFWAGNHINQGKYDALYSVLVPDSGNCETIEGEMLRAASRLQYDFWNNGMCNNTSGAANFLKQCDVLASVKRELDVIYHETNTGGYTNKDLSLELDAVLNAVVEHVYSKCPNSNDLSSLTSNVNNVDMFDFQDSDYYDDDESEWDWGEEEDDEE